MKYMTRSNMAEVGILTGLPMEELEELMTYSEEAGNHHAPIPAYRRSIVQRTRVPQLNPGTSLGADQS